jgi:phage shock protein PspC (stress-responsive transcriptional regulator)
MNTSDDIIQAYIQKLLSIQEEKREQPLNQAEMRKIAEDLGVSSEDLLFIEKKMQDYVARGKGHSRYEDWDSAVYEFQQAVVLSPSNVEALYGLANALKNRYALKRNKKDYDQAKEFVRRALLLNPNHDPSFKLSSELNKGNVTYTKPKSLEDLKKEVFNDFNLPDISSSKKLKRSRRDKKLFGVCGGLAEYFKTDPTWIRIAFVLALFFGGGISIPLYIVLSFILPNE